MGFVNIMRIIEQRDAAAMCGLDEDDLMEVLTELWCSHYHRMPVSDLNDVQLQYFLCMELENNCQADSILNLTDEADVFFRLPLMYQGHLDIGAPQTAAALQRFMELLPDVTFEDQVMPEWKWFFEDDERLKRIREIECFIAGYPDGVMSEKYAQLIRSDRNVAEKLLEI